MASILMVPLHLFRYILDSFLKPSSPITMAFCNALKYPFAKLHNFYKFTLEAKSTKWPGFSRCGIYTLFAALLLSIAQISLHLWLAITLSNLPSEVKECYEGNGIIGFPLPHGKVFRPVTYADIRGRNAFSVGANSVTGYVCPRFVELHPASLCL
jgi:hypothetical protein